MNRAGRAQRLSAVVGVVLLAGLWSVSPSGAQDPFAFPTNDLEKVLGLLGGETPAPVPVQYNEPPLAAVPPAECDASSRPLAGMQGRVPLSAVMSPAAERGWTCNLEVVSHHPTPGGFRVWRYVDRSGHVCAFYDTSLITAANVVSLGAGPSRGVVVLDMSDPARPVQTDVLTAPAMLSPHESLNLNTERGLLAAELGTAGTAPGVMSIYDVKDDCRRPALQSNYLAGPVGHESGFSPDGRTFWIGGAQGIIAVDVTNPKFPRTIKTINAPSHGINLSSDGNTLYGTNAIDGGISLLDVSELQARKTDAHVREISRLSWATASIPQNTNPMTIGGRKYLLEFDEFAFKFNPPTVDDKVGAARIIDIEDPKRPRVVSNLRLQINMRDNHRRAAGDPSFVASPLSNSAHYCAIPREVDPEIAACSFINSGLRIFDIRDPLHPRESAYYIAPPKTSNLQKANAAFAQPAFDPARREVYYSDATSGFWNVRLSDAVWPNPVAPPMVKGACSSRRSVTIRVRRPQRGRITKVTATVGGKRLAVTRKGGRHVVVLRLAGRPRGTVRLRIVVRTSTGRSYKDSRAYRTCTPR